ncbi:MAG: two pore domain potassium channel family protein [Bacteroidetes bacterium]|nr:two pore domain potassium channel family protein [Bacteroidota bacterium]
MIFHVLFFSANVTKEFLNWEYKFSLKKSALFTLVTPIVLFLTMSIFSKLVNIKILSTRKRRFQHSLLLFSLNFIFVFIIGLAPNSSWIPELYSITVSGIFFAAVISISDRHIRYLYFAVILTIFTWVSTYLRLDFILHLTSFITIIFFIYIIVISIIRISGSNDVGSLEFLRSVNMYFLIGIVGAIVFRTLYATDPSSINISDKDVLASTDLVYFSFETITTLGYGDITPNSPLAKNVAVFLSFAGQLYLTMIIALLMGKYLQGSMMESKSNNNDPPREPTNPQ